MLGGVPKTFAYQRRKQKQYTKGKGGSGMEFFYTKITRHLSYIEAHLTHITRMVRTRLFVLQLDNYAGACVTIRGIGMLFIK